MKKKSPSLLLYASSEKNADMLYLCKAFVPDSMLAFVINDQKIGVANALEYSRLIKESDFDILYSQEALIEEAKHVFKAQQPSTAHLIALVAKFYKAKIFTVAPDFPIYLALELQELKIGIDIAVEGLFLERMYKSAKEIKYIQASNKACAAGFEAAQSILKTSKVRQGYLYYQNQRLTSEYLRTAIDKVCLDHGCIAANTIVAGGKQACDPHHRGSGPLKANTLIIIDIFPRNMQTGYYGDMTRTFLKGKATDAQKQLMHTLKIGQQKAFKLLKDNIDATTIHTAAQDHFLKEGYITEKRDTQHVGFFHSIGHGLGLDIHEGPRVSTQKTILKKDMVITIEPGLYYPEIGGGRIEDVFQITLDGYRKLSHFHYEWEIN